MLGERNMEKVKNFSKDEEVVQYKTVGQFSGLGLLPAKPMMDIWTTPPFEPETPKHEAFKAAQIEANLEAYAAAHLMSRDNALNILTEAYYEFLEKWKRLCERDHHPELCVWPGSLNSWLAREEWHRDELIDSITEEAAPEPFVGLIDESEPTPEQLAEYRATIYARLDALAESASARGGHWRNTHTDAFDTDPINDPLGQKIVGAWIAKRDRVEELEILRKRYETVQGPVPYKKWCDDLRDYLARVPGCPACVLYANGLGGSESLMGGVQDLWFKERVCEKCKTTFSDHLNARMLDHDEREEERNRRMVEMSDAKKRDDALAVKERGEPTPDQIQEAIEAQAEADSEERRAAEEEGFYAAIDKELNALDYPPEPSPQEIEEVLADQAEQDRAEQDECNGHEFEFEPGEAAIWETVRDHDQLIAQYGTYVASEIKKELAARGEMGCFTRQRKKIEPV